MRTPHLTALALLAATLVLLTACTSVQPPPAPPVSSSTSTPPAAPIDASAFGVADLDGDGTFEFIVRTPAKGQDPAYVWRTYDPETTGKTTAKIEAYSRDQRLLWRYDMGWGIVPGTWWAPVLAYDIDRDGRDEIYTRWTDGDHREPKERRQDKHQVMGATERLVKLDPATGRVVAEAPWIPEFPGIEGNYNNRHQLAVAYLDGVNPFLILVRGTYHRIRVRAYDRDLRLHWDWDSDTETAGAFAGSASHGVRGVDVDGDGRDEISLGSALLSSEGKGLWTLARGHPDIHHVADIDPDHPGLEIFLAFENHYTVPEGAPIPVDNVCLVAAATGEVLWGNGVRDRTHMHSEGLCSDLIPELPGLELYCGPNYGEERFFYSAKGERLPYPERHGLRGLDGSATALFGAEPHPLVLRRLDPRWAEHTLVADIQGDWREELIRLENGAFVVHETNIPTPHAFAPPRTDRFYRTELARGYNLSGYHYPPRLLHGLRRAPRRRKDGAGERREGLTDA
jgi:hypothetical protein